jgi:hypothetical protein
LTITKRGAAVLAGLVVAAGLGAGLVFLATHHGGVGSTHRIAFTINHKVFQTSTGSLDVCPRSMTLPAQIVVKANGRIVGTGATEQFGNVVDGQLRDSATVTVDDARFYSIYLNNAHWWDVSADQLTAQHWQVTTSCG